MLQPSEEVVKRRKTDFERYKKSISLGVPTAAYKAESIDGIYLGFDSKRFDTIKEIED